MKSLLLSLLFVPILSSAQSVTPQVIGSSGDHFTASSGQLSWTLGEISIETYNGTSSQLTQGFHQPENGLVSISENQSQLFVNAYPNPFQNNIQIEIANNEAQFTIVVMDALGKQVIKQKHTGTGPQIISFENLASGIYYLSVSNSNEIIKTLKIQKM